MAMTEERTRAYKASFVPVQRLLDAGRFPDAVAELERLAAANTECAEAHNDLAVLYHAAGRLGDADRESRRALELDPFHADIRDNRNAIATALGNATPAAARPPAPASVAAISFAPPPPVTPISFAPPAPVTPISFAPTAPVTPISFAPPAPVAAPAPVSVSNFSSASRTVIAPPTTSALAGAPLYGEVLRTAETLLASGQLDAAVAEIERFVDKQPATAEAWNDLGVLHRDAGRFPAAKAALVVALTIEPENRQAGHNLTRVLLEMGQHTEALRALEPFLTRAPRDPEALTLAGDISFALHHNEDAGAFYRAALTVEPANVEVAVKLANAAATASVLPPPIAAAPAPSVYLPPTAPPAPPASPSVLPDTLRALEYDPRVRLVTPDETYDTVTCKIPLDRLPNPIAALAEMTRLLKPGGKLWIDLGGPLEVIKHGPPKAPATGAVIDLLPAFRAR